MIMKAGRTDEKLAIRKKPLHILGIFPRSAVAFCASLCKSENNRMHALRAFYCHELFIAKPFLHILYQDYTSSKLR